MADVNDRGPVVRFVKRTPVLNPLARRLYDTARRLYFARLAARDVKAVTRRNTRRAYEKLFGRDELLDEYLGPERLMFYEEVAQVCAVFGARHVVDIGCGSGHLLRALAARTPNAHFVGVDFSRNAIRRACKVLPEARWVVGDAYAPPVQEASFDLVLCTEVLEHLDRPRDMLDALARLCTPGGHVVVTVPDGELDAWEGHVNFWSESELASFLARLGHREIQRIDGGRTLLAVISF